MGARIFSCKFYVCFRKVGVPFGGPHSEEYGALCADVGFPTCKGSSQIRLGFALIA